MTVLLVCAAAPARAAAEAPPTATPAATATPATPAPPVVPEAAEPAAEADTTDASPRGFDSPSWVMARSALFPGWGQAKNGAWWKALLVAGLESAFLERLYYEDRMTGIYRARAAATPVVSDEHAFWDAKTRRHIGHRRNFTWWTGLLIAVSVADAYVDAHLRGFNVRLEGAPEETGAPVPGQRGAKGVSIALSFAW
jgi:hypothetical protein